MFGTFWLRRSGSCSESSSCRFRQRGRVTAGPKRSGRFSLHGNVGGQTRREGNFPFGKTCLVYRCFWMLPGPAESGSSPTRTALPKAFRVACKQWGQCRHQQGPKRTVKRRYFLLIFTNPLLLTFPIKKALTHCQGFLLSGTPGGTRTHNPRLRRPVLCPVELRAHLHFPFQWQPRFPVPVNRPACSLVDIQDWSGQQDLNLRPPAPKAGALTRLRYVPLQASEQCTGKGPLCQKEIGTGRKVNRKTAKAHAARTRRPFPVSGPSSSGGGCRKRRKRRITAKLR